MCFPLCHISLPGSNIFVPWLQSGKAYVPLLGIIYIFFIYQVYKGNQLYGNTVVKTFKMCDIYASLLTH